MKRIALTGAASGIGRETARILSGLEHPLQLIDRDGEGLAALGQELGGDVELITADLAMEENLSDLCAKLASTPPDVLVNNAGIQNFAPFEKLPLPRIEAEFRINVLAPMALCQAVIPGMRERGSGQIVNIASVFGSIAFAYFSTYSSTKFAIRGFSEALRRELAGTGIRVSYVAPRAARTGLATQTQAMAEAVGMKMDPPAKVAGAVVRMIQRGGRSRVVGFPESFFVRLNALFPGLVDRALRKQNQKTRPFAEEAIGRILGRARGPEGSGPGTTPGAEGSPEWAA